ncbi:helix-turn-helix domain-containing protein [Actinokineospora sp. NPDC004072]
MSSRAPRLTAAEKQTIIDLYLTKVDGRWPTNTAIARQINRSRTAVENTIEKAGVARRKKRRLTTGEKKRIIALYQTWTGTRWTSTLEISKIVGRPPSTINRVVTEAGITRTISEALSAHVPGALRQQIIHLYTATGWSYPKVAEHLKIGSRVVYDVLDAADAIVRQGPNRMAKVRIKEARRLVALYQQGLSAREVAERTGRTRGVVESLVRDAGVQRTRSEAARMASRRRAARIKLAAMAMRPVARRWITGTTVEDLSKEQDVPVDLMWEALSRTLTSADFRRRRAVTGEASNLASLVGNGRESECGLTCPYACVAVCARTLGRRDQPSAPNGRTSLVDVKSSAG